jgi:hypothetical protein
VRGLDAFLSPAVVIPQSFHLTAGSPILAYGPVPGVELIPYFVALLGWLGLAFAAVVLAPITALLRRLRKPQRGCGEEPKADEVTGP